MSHKGIKITLIATYLIVCVSAANAQDDYFRLQRNLVRKLAAQTPNPCDIWLDRKMASDIARLGGLYISTGSFILSPSWFGGTSLAVKTARELCPQPAPQLLTNVSTGLGAAGILRNTVRENWAGAISGTSSLLLGQYGNSMLEGLNKPIIVRSSYPINEMRFDSFTGGIMKITGQADITKIYQYNPYSLKNWPKFGIPGPLEGTSRVITSSNVMITSRSGNLTNPFRVMPLGTQQNIPQYPSWNQMQGQMNQRQIQQRIHQPKINKNLGYNNNFPKW